MVDKRFELSRTLARAALAAVGLAMVAAVAAGPARAADPIRIGLVAGISGACGPLVDGEVKAVELGVDQLNAKGGLLGRPIELIKRDSKTKPDEGAKLARELVLNDKVDVLTGTCSSAVMLAVSAVSKELKTPFYSTIGNSQKANIEAFQPYFWQTQAHALMEAAAAAEFVAGHADWKRVVPMGFDYEWGHTSVDTFVAHLKQLRPDMEIADPLFPKIGESNMTSYITAALAQKPDVVYAAVFGGGLINLIKQGKSFGFFQRASLVTLMTVDTMQALAKDMPAKGVSGYARAPFFELMGNPKAKAFVEAYRERYGVYPDDWATSSYDGLMYLAAAIEAAGGTDADKLMAAVTSITVHGLRGDALKVRDFDHLMNAPVYVGDVTTDSPYGFPIMKNVVRIDADKTMPSKEQVEKLRAAAQ
ncbi:amino acid/amide ABC transporter substrate-binding protein, HAAT family [Tistlia consotensis]|uniref:Amino acid/amide ABC transporter substrate-binding protein, HAAT family n=1 Tax=Tistlia consotensis USBA 355 TaxID=560819 RepID=A0A1Y6B5K8_9PROT|nr:ABC transporter substrate-binding protein [Tistlia consotensis]SME91018.1 amino acid/amide ABC transporter substrate-binding protein, HAAT family [Tistlia consotensis USBA 355]SNR27064.1 amino acid/amide ABC transporter substrate-binding protein, HAAT family [Tistlia consotensis]